MAAYSKLFWEIELMSIATSMAALAAWILLIVTSSTYRIFYLVMIPSILGAMLNITWFFNGLEKFKLTVIRNIFFRLAGILLMFTFVKEKSDVVIYVAILSLINLLSSASLWIYIPKLTVRISLNELKIVRHFKQTLTYFIPTIATSIYTVLDKTLIGWITKSDTQNGFYEQAENVIRVANRLTYSGINAVVGVRISYLFAENRIEEIHSRIENSMNYIFFMGVGCACGISAIAKRFIPLYFGAGYEGVVNLVYVLCPVCVIIGVSNCMGSHYYTPSGRRMQSSKYLIAGSCVNLVMNLCLIPYLQAIGAAIATVIAELTITALYVRNSNNFMSLKLLIQTGWKKMLSGIIMFVIVFPLRKLLIISELVSVIVQIMTGFGVYVLMLYLLQDQWTIGCLNRLTDRVQQRIKAR